MFIEAEFHLSYSSLIEEQTFSLLLDERLVRVDNSGAIHISRLTARVTAGSKLFTIHIY